MPRIACSPFAMALSPRAGHAATLLLLAVIGIISCCCTLATAASAPSSPHNEELAANGFVPSTQCNCSMVLFRHLAKTGGTSVAVFFSQLERKVGG